MTEKRSKSSKLDNMRKRAEGEIQLETPVFSEAMLPPQATELLHELRVNQVELEMQNDELIHTEEKLGLSYVKYFDFYNLAPVGYFTISEGGLVLEVNLTATNLLGMTRDKLVNQPFTRLIAAEDHDTYYLFHKKLVETQMPQSCELRMARKDASRFWARLEAAIAYDMEGAPMCHFVMSDITDRMEAEREIQLQRDNFLRILNAITDGIYIVNRDCDIEYVNPVIEREFGKVEGRKCHTYFHDRAEPCPWCKNEEVFNGKSVRWEWSSPKTGKSYDLLDAPITNPDGSVSKFEIFHDITERKRMEDALGESEERYRSLFENSHASMLVINPDDGAIVDANPSAVAYYGWTRDELQRKNISDINTLTPDQIRAEMELARTEKRNHFIFKHRRAHGEPRDVEVYSGPIKMHGRDLLYSIIFDITDRKQAEEALAQSELNYRTVADFTNDWETWREPDGRFRYVSPSCERITGYPPERFIADPDFLISIMLRQDIETYNKHIANSHTTIACSDGLGFEPERLMFRITRKDGQVRWIEHVCQRVFDENGLFIGNRGSNRDITDLVAAREQAEAATKLKDQFVSLVAHDLRSPFTSMMGLLRHFVDSKSLLANEEDQKVLDAVFQSGDRMLKMIEGLLKISGIQTGKITPRPRFFKCHMAVAVTIGSISHTAAQKGVEIVNEVSEGMRLYADQMLFDEVLLNLLTNSIKFCSRGDRITFFAPPGLKSAIAIRDTGKGIEEKIIPKLFRHEVKTTTVGTAGEVGTGLGLPYSYDIIKAHGGEITVESAPGKGTVFCVMLPYVRPIALIVDDEPMSLLLARSHLERAGIEVIEALSGEKALAAIKDKRPHIVIADINMPGMDGFMLLDRLKQDGATSGIPVIVMTSMESETRENAFRHGADDFVSKPIEPQDFIPRVRRFVG